MQGLTNHQHLNKSKVKGWSSQLLLFLVVFFLLLVSSQAATQATASQWLQNNVCFSYVGKVPSSPRLFFSLKNTHSDLQQNYTSSDFDVKYTKTKEHPFFKRLSKYSQIQSTIRRMSCKQVDKTADPYFRTAFGNKTTYSCKVPAKHLLFAVRFVPKLPAVQGSGYGKWYVFTHLQFTPSQKKISYVINKNKNILKNMISRTRLQSVNVVSGLQILPEWIGDTLKWMFNNNRQSSWIQSVSADRRYDLEYDGYLKVFGSGVEVIMGGLANSSSSVYQIYTDQPGGKLCQQIE